MGRIRGKGDDALEANVERGWMEVVRHDGAEPVYRMTAKGLLHVEYHLGPGSRPCNCDGLCFCGVYRVPNGRFCEDHLAGSQGGA